MNAARTDQSSYYGFFLQDDFRVRSELTLNLGLRRRLVTSQANQPRRIQMALPLVF